METKLWFFFHQSVEDDGHEFDNAFVVAIVIVVNGDVDEDDDDCYINSIEMAFPFDTIVNNWNIYERCKLKSIIIIIFPLN